MTRRRIALALAVAVCAWTSASAAATAASNPNVMVGIVAAQEGANGLAITLQLTVSCPSSLESVGITASVTQGRPSGTIASASGGNNSTCTGQPHQAPVVFSTCQTNLNSCGGFRAGPARIFVDVSYQNQFLLRHKESVTVLTAIRSAAVLRPSPYMSPALSGRLAAGGTGVTTNLTFRCPKPSGLGVFATLQQTGSAGQTLDGFALVQGLPAHHHCNTGTHTVQLTFISSAGTSPPWHGGLALMDVGLTLEYPHSAISTESLAVVRLR